MIEKLRRLAAVLPPVRFLSEQKRNEKFRRDAMRRAKELRPRMVANANAINDLAGRIHSLEDARKLVDLVAAEIFDGLAREWKAESVRNMIAEAEFEAAAQPGGLIPEQRVAVAWNNYLEKIGAPQESHITEYEIHALRDTLYVSSQLSWARCNQNVWTVNSIYAVDADGKVARGCRPLEVLNILWMIYSHTSNLERAREMMNKGQRLSDIYKDPLKPTAPDSVKYSVAVRIAPPNPVKEAASRYARDHGSGALRNAVACLLEELFSAK